MPELSEADRTQIARYVQAMYRALAPLPKEERDEIVHETESHLLDRVSAGSPLAKVTDELGDPVIYARRFVENHRVDMALASGSAWHMLRAAGSLIGRGSAAFVGFPIFLVLFTTSIGLVLAALLKPFAPSHVGLWAAPDSLTLGWEQTPGPGYRELLGWWIVVIGLVGGSLLYLISRRLLSVFLSYLRRGG